MLVTEKKSWSNKS